MRRVLLVGWLCVVAFFTHAQSVPELLRLADASYESNRYLEAIPYYKKVFGIDKKNYYAGFQLASCFEKTLQYEEAKDRFKALGEISGHEFQTRALYNYATLLKVESQFDFADSLYQLIVRMPNISADLMELANKQREGCLLAKAQKDKDRNANVRELKHLNDNNFHDFGAIKNPATGHLVFVTTRNLPGAQYKGSQYAGILPELVAFEERGNEHWRNVSGRQKLDKLNTRWAEGSGTFTNDGQKFYFTSCRGEGGTECQIFVTNLEDDRWGDPEPLNEFVNEKGSENKQPSLSWTGDTLFFVSNRPGGSGGSDIWMSLRGDSAETWTPAINMGDVINTSENEITPYYSSANGSLLFSSNGHIGYGGYDIYGAKGNAFFKPDLFNIGQPFNSTWDDTYFSISDTSGHFSSNRRNKELLDIYAFDVSDEELFLSLLFAGEMLIDGQVVSKFRDASSIDLVTFRAEDYEGYALFQPVQSKKKHLRQLFSEKPKEKPKTVYRSGESFEQIFFDYELSTLRSESKKALDDFYISVKDQSYTRINLLAFADNIGSEKGNINLSKKRGFAVKNYLVTKGIPESKISVLPRGEIVPQGNDHWFKRVFSRRVELHIETEQPFKVPVAKGVILRRPMTLEAVAKRLRLDPADLYKWNGRSNVELSAGNTIRLFISNKASLDPKYFITQKNVAEVFQ